MSSKTADTDKVMNPVMVPEEPSDIHQDIGNQIPGVEIEENLDSIIESIMSPMIIHHTHAEEDESLNQWNATTRLSTALYHSILETNVVLGYAMLMPN